ncbi:MAG: hypothetical protein KY460_12055 [Actinobacteria bacterium]|nr:hypothetical protein [Actinomycetota bacterium]
MAEADRTPGDGENDSADTASFQQFMDERETATTDDGRTFRLLSLLVGIVVLVIAIYLLLL